MRTWKNIFELLFITLLCSCSTKYIHSSYSPRIVTSYNSFGSYNFAGKSFYIESAISSLLSNDPEFRQYAKYVKEVMQLYGATPTEDKLKADVCMLMDYAISDESYIANVPIPIWGPTGIESIQTNSRITGSAYGNAYAYGNSISGSVYGNLNRNTTTTVNHTYGITGVYTTQRKVEQYRRVMNLYAYDNKNRTGDVKMLWKANMQSDGYKNDLSHVFPFMTYALLGTVGSSSGGWKTETTYEDDYMFLVWKKGYLTQHNITPFPYCDSGRKSENMIIAFVELLSDEVIVVLRKDGYKKHYGISSQLVLEYNGKSVPVSHIDNYKLGSQIWKEHGSRYFRVHFPINVPYSAVINIMENKKNGHFWYGVRLK